MQHHSRKPGHARHAPVLLALLPLLPPLGLLALARLSALRELAPPVRTVLVVFVTTQLLAALLTPDVLVALGAALARSLLICALVALGAALPMRALRWLLVGLAGVQLTALGVSAASWSQGSWPHDPGDARLWHPYVTSVTLGLGGALSVWLAAFAPGVPRGARLAAAALGLTTLLLSGSRGPLLALLIGLVAPMTVGGRLGGGRSRFRLAAVLAAPLVALALIVTTASTGPTARLLSADLNSRDLDRVAQQGGAFGRGGQWDDVAGPCGVRAGGP